MEIYDALTLESKGKDSIDKHGSFILDILYKPCSHNSAPKSAMLSEQSMHKDYNRLMVLSCKRFQRMVVDA
jgi:hypothetical protein